MLTVSTDRDSRGVFVFTSLGVGLRERGGLPQSR